MNGFTDDVTEDEVVSEGEVTKDDAAAIEVMFSL